MTRTLLFQEFNLSLKSQLALWCLLAGFVMLPGMAHPSEFRPKPVELGTSTEAFLPVLEARGIRQDFEPARGFDEAVWRSPKPVRIERTTEAAKLLPALSSTVRALWSGKYLYLRYDCPFTELRFFEPVQTGRKRFGTVPGANLWDRDVVEAFIAGDAEEVSRYAEFEVAPTNEKLDLMILGKGRSDFDWTSGFESAVRVDQAAKVWTCLMRIPLSAWGAARPSAGTRWRLNLFRCDQAHGALMAWNPTLTGSFHEPRRFGVLTFVE